jgi:uncharacterized protein (TIGR02145 family)
MKISVLLLVFCYCQIVSGQPGTITDKRNGQVYKTIQIGNQIWMAENLNVTTFQNGDLIPESKTQEEWNNAGRKKQPTWCYYNNDPKNGAIYGKLYNWYAVNDPRGLSPVGYHVGTEDDWKKLISYLGGEKIAGIGIKNSNEWWEGCEISKNFGFSAIPAGVRYASFLYIGSPTFDYLGENGRFWTSTEFSTVVAFYKEVSCSSIISVDAEFKEVGMSVRCVKD